MTQKHKPPHIYTKLLKMILKTRFKDDGRKLPLKYSLKNSVMQTQLY